MAEMRANSLFAFTASLANSLIASGACRYMSLETIAPLSDDPIVKLPGVPA